ncbi:hypothetical protein D3C83_20790 [compost metagenome]
MQRLIEHPVAGRIQREHRELDVETFVHALGNQALMKAAASGTQRVLEEERVAYGARALDRQEIVRRDGRALERAALVEIRAMVRRGAGIHRGGNE